MDVIKMMSDFLLSSWIWHITFDRFHPFVTSIAMFCLLRFVMRRKRLISLAISISAQLFAFGLLTAKVVFLLINILQVQFEPVEVQEAVHMMAPLYPSIALGLIYAIFQSFFFICGRLLWRYNLTAFLVMTWVSNGIGVFVSYMLINMMDLYYYVG